MTLKFEVQKNREVDKSHKVKFLSSNHAAICYWQETNLKQK